MEKTKNAVSELKKSDFQEAIKNTLKRYNFSEETHSIIENENLLPTGLLQRLQINYPQYAGIIRDKDKIFKDKKQYAGLKGFREIVSILKDNGIDMGYIEERELFIKIYRFMATRHVLNAIDWNDFNNDSLFQLVFPQPDMIDEKTIEAYKNAKSEEERQKLVDDYIKSNTNPHDGKQQLNKPWYEDEEGGLEILEGSQHKYPQCQLIFDKTTQSCFAFCTYCFRHAQVRGDEDMFSQEEIQPIHEYLKKHKEVTDILITGGDGGYMPYDRLKEYLMPLVEDNELAHIKTVRIGSRALTYYPEFVLGEDYTKYLELFKYLIDNGVQIAWMAHFSTPREILNLPSIAATKRLKAYGVTVRSQSPIMNHISLFTDETGKVDVDKSAQNWIDLANIFAMLGIGFHSMYLARPTGEHHYFSVPVAEIDKVFSKIYRSLPSINRPSRYITQTSSAGKVSIIGTTEVNGDKVFVLKFNESRNMEWMDKVFLAKYDEDEITIENLEPYEGEKFFFEDELKQIEDEKTEKLSRKMKEKNLNQ
jgi:L-lysine 2,3-aminomutase